MYSWVTKEFGASASKIYYMSGDSDIGTALTSSVSLVLTIALLTFLGFAVVFLIKNFGTDKAMSHYRKAIGFCNSKIFMH